MKKKLLNAAADKIFEYFENNCFRNDLRYDRDTNLAFEFADYIAHQSDEEIADSINSTHAFVGAALRKIMDRAIDSFLGNPYDDLMKALSKSQKTDEWEF